MNPIVRLVNAGVSRGGRPVLIDIDLDVRPGTSLGVAGPNGSGKTTLVRAIATLLSIDAGSGEVLGADLNSSAISAVRSSIGLIGHHPGIIPELTLTENLIHVARLSGIAPGRVGNALGVVGLSAAADWKASECSFGMQRRVEIARLLLTKPRLLLLDEAATGLDESARDLIGALIESVRHREGAAVVVSHDRSHLESLCDTVHGLRAGRLETST